MSENRDLGNRMTGLTKEQRIRIENEWLSIDMPGDMIAALGANQYNSLVSENTKIIADLEAQKEKLAGELKDKLDGDKKDNRQAQK